VFAELQADSSGVDWDRCSDCEECALNCPNCNAQLREPQVAYRNIPSCLCCQRDGFGILAVVGTETVSMCNDCYEQSQRIARIDYINGVGTVKVPFDAEGK
jgi:hypothetical protein